jgi:hypothetical protein
MWGPRFTPPALRWRVQAGALSAGAAALEARTAEAARRRQPASPDPRTWRSGRRPCHRDGDVPDRPAVAHLPSGTRAVPLAAVYHQLPRRARPDPAHRLRSLFRRVLRRADDLIADERGGGYASTGPIEGPMGGAAEQAAAGPPRPSTPRGDLQRLGRRPSIEVVLRYRWTVSCTVEWHALGSAARHRGGMSSSA